MAAGKWKEEMRRVEKGVSLLSAWGMQIVRIHWAKHGTGIIIEWKVLQKSVESELNNHMESVSGKHMFAKQMFPF